MKNIKISFNNLIKFCILLILSAVISGCYEGKIIRKADCKITKSANKIVIVNERTKLIYDPTLDKECLSSN